MPPRTARLGRSTGAAARDRRDPYPSPRPRRVCPPNRAVAGPAQGNAQLRLPRSIALTAAELRLLPLLSTYLSFPEIGEEMCLSPNTIKSQACSIYRKLGVSSRNQAVMQSRKLS